MHYPNLFNNICASLDSDIKTLKRIISTYGFKSIDNVLSPLISNGKHLTYVYSVKYDCYSLTIEISTDVEHACYSDQEETHYLAVSLCENDVVINSKTYTYLC